MTVLLLITTILLVPAELELEPVHGPLVVGTLSEWNDKELVVLTALGKVAIRTEDLLSVSVRKDNRKSEAHHYADEKKSSRFWLELVDGSLLSTASYRVTGSTVSVRLVGDQQQELPLRSVAAVYQNASPSSHVEQWQEIRHLEPTEDLMVVRKSKALDHLGGLLGDVTNERVHFQVGSERFDVPWKKIEGLIYYRSGEDQLPKAACVVITHDGGRLRARQLTWFDNRVRAKGLTGLVVDWPLTAIDKFDLSSGRIRYLSDLEPESVEWTPYLPLTRQLTTLTGNGPLVTDRALGGGPLRLRAKEYQKGLAMRSRTKLTYRLSRGHRLFSAQVGIDDRVGPRGYIKLVVLGDGRKLFESPIRGRDDPVSLRLDIRNIDRLTILVDFGDDLDVADHLNLCEAKIIQ